MRIASLYNKFGTLRDKSRQVCRTASRVEKGEQCLVTVMQICHKPCHRHCKDQDMAGNSTKDLNPA